MERVRLPVNRGVACTSGNMIDYFSGNMEIEGNWIELEPAGPYKWNIVNDSMSERDGDWIVDSTDLGYYSRDGEAQPLDTSSDGYQCFEVSQNIRWKDVTFNEDSIIAPSLQRIEEALQHIEICAWCPGDI